MTIGPDRPKSRFSKIAQIIGLISSVLTILAYFGITGIKDCSSGEKGEKKAVILVETPGQNPEDKSGNNTGVLSGDTKYKRDDNNFPNKPPGPIIERNPKTFPLSIATAVLVVETETSIDWSLSSTILEELRKKGIKTTKPPVFNKSFLTSGQFSKLFEGDLKKGTLSQLPGYFKTGVLGRKTVTYTQNTELSNLITASMTLELHVVSSFDGAVRFSCIFSQKGAGFSNDDAGKIAEENILKELESQLPKIIDNLGD